MSAFEELGICPEIIRAVEADEWLLPTAVQQEAVPLILTGGDVLVAAETGSGKTGAFGLPCLQIVHETLRGKCQMRDPGASNLKCELDSNDKDMFVQVGEGGVQCKSESGDRWYGARATVEVLQGRYMYEVEVVSGLVRVGWSSASSALELGMEYKSFGYGSTGKKSSNRAFEDYGEAFEEGDIIGCLLDRAQQTIAFFKNGKDLGIAFKLASDLDDVGLKPHLCGKKFSVVANFDGPMEYPVEGFAAVGDINPAHAGSSVRLEGKRLPLCMILEPTRSLADQTYQCMTKFSKYLENPSVRVGLFVGGVDHKEQVRSLEQGVDICVGTLERTMDMIRRGHLDTSQIKFFVLDEADDVQKKDTKQDLSQLNSLMKRGRKDRVQTLLFSATLHTAEISELIDEITSRPVWVDLKGKDSVPDTVHHVVYSVDPELELPWDDEHIAAHAKDPHCQPRLDGVHESPSMSAFDADYPDQLKMSQRVKQMKPKLVVKLADAFKMPQCLVFCRTNVDCDNLEAYFNALGGAQRGFGGKMESGKENPYSCVVLAGARNQKERQRNLDAFKDGDVRFLICTDVAARGLDIVGLPYVIQMTLPDDIENYIHRIGRCGRAERLGLCISLVATRREKVWYHRCPSRGKKCKNTKLTVPFAPDGKPRAADEAKWLVDEGGCTIWFDEPDLVQQVEVRVGRATHVMDKDDFSVPGIVESPLDPGLRKQRTEVEVDQDEKSRRALKRKHVEETQQKAVVYGAKRSDATAAAAAGHASTIAPTVVELKGLETRAQQLFTQAMWGALHVGGGLREGEKQAALEANVAPVTVSNVPRPAVSQVQTTAVERPKKKVRW